MNETERAKEMAAWRYLFEDDVYRLGFPKDFHRTLMTRADELLARGVICESDWNLLKDAADQAYKRTCDGLERNEKDCVNLASLRLPGDVQ